MSHISQIFYLDQRPMTEPKKSTRTMRTREDYDLFKITYPYYDPQVLKTIQLHLGPGQYLSSGSPIASAHIRKSQFKSLQNRGETQQSFPLTTYVAGKIQKIGCSFSMSETGWKLAQGLKKSSIELVHIRQCQHIINNQSITNSNITSSFDNSSLNDKCPYCGKTIWIYYKNQEQIVTIQALIAANPNLRLQSLEELEWTIVLNQQFTGNTVIAKAGEKEISLPVLAKATYLLRQGEKPVNNVVMRIRRGFCRHEKIIDNRCQFCLQQISPFQMQTFTRYLFQLGSHNIGKIFSKGAVLLQQEQQYINSLLQKQKVILILDLDNTILHSNEMNQLEPKDLLKLKDFFLIPKIQQLQDGQFRQDHVIVKIRPYLKEFLFIVGYLFQLYVYTKGTRIYADGICKWIRHQWAGQPSPYDLNTWSQPPLNFLKKTQCFVSHRVISRDEDNNLETKSIHHILPSSTQYHMILDDRREVWNNSPNWFFTRQYYYFFKRRRNPNQTFQRVENLAEVKKQQNQMPYLPKLLEYYSQMRHKCPLKQELKVDTSDRSDFFLLFAAHAFKRIHSCYFDQFKSARQEKNKQHRLQIIKEEKKSVAPLTYILKRLKLFLKSKSVRFFTTPNDESLSTARRALKLGATLFINKEKPDYVIRGNNYMKFVKKWRQQQQTSQKEAYEPQRKEVNVLQAQVKPQARRQKIQALQKIELKQHKPQLTLKNQPQQPSQANIEPQANRKSKLDLQIQKQIKQPKTDYELELRQLAQLHKKGVPVIAETWILACYEFTYKFRLQDFKLEDPFKQNVQHSDFDACITKAAERIKGEIHQQINTFSSYDNQKERMKQQRDPSSNSFKKEKQRAPIIIKAQKKQRQSKNQQNKATDPQLKDQSI